MGDPFDGVALAMGEVIARIDAPLRTRARVFGMQDAIEHGVAQRHVARRHVDLRPEHARPIGELAGAHAAQQIEVLLHRPLAPRAVAPRLGQGAAGLAHLGGRLVVDIGLAGLDQMLGPVIELLEMVRSMVEMLAPVEAEPAHVAHDGVDVLLLLPGRVGVVEAQMAAPAELRRHAEVQADGLGVADVQIAVGLRREARDDLLVAPRRDIGADDVPDEIARISRRLAHAHAHRSIRRTGRRSLCGRLGCARQGSSFTTPVMARLDRATQYSEA
jgi:hypothetical protein